MTDSKNNSGAFPSKNRNPRRDKQHQQHVNPPGGKPSGRPAPRGKKGSDPRQNNS